MKQVSDKETKIILELAMEAVGLEGDFVELGCYRGDTSLLLQKLLHGHGFDRRLFLYDSFEGLPERTKEDASIAGDGFKKGELDVTKKEVILRFKKAGLPVPKIKKAFFEDLEPADLPEKIAFAFLDGDLYGSIKTSLDLVLPRLVSGATLLIHDYNNPGLPGVARAVDERHLRGSPRETLFISVA